MKRIHSFFTYWIWLALFLPISFSSQTVANPSLVKGKQLADVYTDTGGEILLDFGSLAGESNSETEIDFSDMAPFYGISKEEEPFMKIDLALKNWEVYVPPASRWLAFQYPSYLAEASVKQGSIIYSGEKVLGVRLFFPPGRQDSYAVIPPFPLPFYSGENGNQFLNRGVIKNVGVIKEVQLETYGQYYNVEVTLVLEDMEGREFTIPLGNLNFLGWRSMVWKNPAYSKLSTHNIRIPKHDNPVSPPAYRFKKLVFSHGAYDRITDVVVYIKSLKVIYDKAWEEEAIQVDNEAFFRSYYNSLDPSGFPSYKIYILERFLTKSRASILKSKESFIKATPVVSQKE